MASSSNATPPRIAWIGLGNMGRGIVKNMVTKASYTPPLLIYNRTISVAEEFAAALHSDQVQVARLVEECVQASDIIFTCVGNDAAIKSIINTSLASSSIDGKLFVDCSTIHPNTTDELATKLGPSSFVACPLFGPKDVAEAGRLVVALAGSKSNVEKIKPICEGVFARAAVDLSDKPHSIATKLKVVGNMFVFHFVEALSEAHVVAEKCGLGSQNLQNWIELMYPGPLTAYSTRFVSGDYYQNDAQWTADLAKKDYGHAKSLADEGGAQVKGLDVVGQHVQDLIGYAGESADIIGVYGIVRREAGMEFENKK